MWLLRHRHRVPCLLFVLGSDEAMSHASRPSIIVHVLCSLGPTNGGEDGGLVEACGACWSIQGSTLRAMHQFYMAKHVSEAFHQSWQPEPSQHLVHIDMSKP